MGGHSGNNPAVVETDVMPSQWFGELRPDDPPEKKLWLAVVTDALRCITYAGKNARRLRDAREARAWLIDSPHCEEVFDEWFEIAYRRFRQALLNQLNARLFKTLRIHPTGHGRIQHLAPKHERAYKRAVGRYVVSGSRRRNQDSDW